MFNIGDLLKIAKEAKSLFDGVKGKLLGQPDEAAQKLALVFEEISKIFLFIDAATVNYLRLYIAPDRSNVVDCRSVLLGIEGGQLAIKGDETRGHCHKIQNIYNRFLQRWFNELLNNNEQAELSYLFHKLGNMDDYMVRGLKTVCDWLQNEAHDILNLIDDSRFDEANAKIKAARLQLLQPRREISEAVHGLRALQADFIEASGTV
jgi:hypothetical protein